MKRMSQAVLLSLVLASSARVHAQEEPVLGLFGDKGHLVIGGERMLGYAHARQDETSDGVTRTTTSSSISLLGSPSSSSAYTFPRVGFDVFIAPSISLGASLTYFRTSMSVGGSDFKVNGILVAPRVGFAARLAPAVWLWPRAGITYVYDWSEVGGAFVPTSGSSNLFAATIEAPVVLALAPQTLALIGPTIDVGLSGSNKASDATGSFDHDFKETDIGLQASFMFYF